MLKLKLILEGPDGSGKSTLAEYLHRTYCIEPIHSSGPSKTAAAFRKRLKDFQAVKAPAICDRNPAISEIIYGTLLRGETIVKRETLLESLYEDERQYTLYIYCCPPLELIMGKEVFEKAWKKKEHCDAVTEKRLEIIRTYEAFLPFIKRKYRVLCYNWSCDAKWVVGCIDKIQTGPAFKNV
jgi:hypothetical protein